MLNYIGLDPTTHRVYLTLASGQATTVQELAKALDLSECQVRGSMDRLSELTLAAWDDPDRPTMVVDPVIGLKALLARKRAELAERQSQMERAQLEVEQWLAVNEAATDNDPAATVVALPGADAVRDKLVELAQECRDEVWSFNPGGMQTTEQLLRARPLNEETLARGVMMRAVYLDSARNHKETAEHLRWLANRGADVRLVPVLPVRMIVVDRQVALVPIDERDTSLGALLVTSRGLVSGLVALFLTTWRIARPLGSPNFRSEDGLSTQERHALVLWAQGYTDASVSRRLGVSQRTVRRMSEALSARVKARSRFELGVRAMSLGWITEGDLD